LNREQALEEIKGRLGDYLISQGVEIRSNFKCLNPEHTDNNPSMGYDSQRKKAHCFSCGADYDTLDLIGIDYGLDSFNDQLNKGCEIFGISYQTAGANNQTQKAAPAETVDYTAFFLEANQYVNRTDYPQKRGLSEEVINRFNLGYAPNWRHPKVSENVPTTPRLIIPTSAGSYLARDIREYIPEDQRQYTKSKVGSVQLFNKEALKQDLKPVFIVEAELDALSVIEASGEAVGLGSSTNTNKLLEFLEANKPSQTLILSLDNDEAGEDATKKLSEGLKQLNIDFCISNIAGTFKDANEALIAEKEAFIERISKAERAEEEQYLQNSAAFHLQEFIDNIVRSTNAPAVSTGFTALDHVLDGGLYPGLYIVGAISSLGKTTLVTQIADQIAESGEDVLIFSLEMARAEIMAKSISRLTLLDVLQNNGSVNNAKTTRGIMSGKRWEGYSQTEKNLIMESMNAYAKYADHIYISEGIGDIGAMDIRMAINKHIRCTKKKPVIIVDYLQILAPYNDRMSDKQNTDKAVMELKRISRDFQVPVIGISSFNRANYKTAVSMEAFKESGAIEYSSDVLIGLQLKGVGTDNFDANEAKNKNPRDVELVILKNRNGATGNKIAYEYYPLFNYFKES